MSSEDRDKHLFEQLLGEALAQVDGPPAAAIEGASALFDFIDADAQLALLIDSEPVALRDPNTRQLVFEWFDEQVRLHLQLGRNDRTMHLTGLTTGSSSDQVVLECANGTAHSVALVHDSFETEVEDCEQFRLRLTTASPYMITPWIASDGNLLSGT